MMIHKYIRLVLSLVAALFAKLTALAITVAILERPDAIRTPTT